MGDPPPKPRLADALLEAGWLLVAFVTPLVVNLWSSQPFEPPKAVLVRSAVWAMAAVWLVDALLARRAVWHDLAENPLLWPILALAGVCVLATAAGVAPALSLWGSEVRAQGLPTSLSYLLLLLLVSARLRTRLQFEHLAKAIVATAVPLVLLGLAQALGWRPLPLISTARSQVHASLGRSNFLGAYLAMLLPLTLAWASTVRRRWQRAAAMTLALGELAVIALTLARGAWLAAGAALAVLVLAWICPRLRLRAAWGPRLAVVAGALLVLAIGLAVAIPVSRAKEGSLAARRTIWRATLSLIVRRPWLGYGPEALGLVFPQVHPPELVYYQGREEFVDRAHNLVLDGLATAGAMGLAAQAALLATWLALVWRILKRGADPWQRTWLFACLAAMAANLSGNLVSFDVTASAVLAMLVMALTVALSRPFEEPGPSPGRRASVPSPGRWAAAGLVILATSAAVAEANVRPLAAGVAARAADRRAAAGDWSGAARAGEQAVALWPVEPGYLLSLGQVYFQAALAAPDPQPGLERTEAALLAAGNLRPDDWRSWALLGLLYAAWGNRWDSSRLPLAHAAYQRATELAPGYAALHAEWGMVDLLAGEYADAAASFRRAVALDASDADAFCRLGDAELLRGRLFEALDAYRQAVHWQPDLAPAHVGLAHVYWRLGQGQEARRAVDQALQLDPGNAAAQDLQRQIQTAP